MTAVLSTLRGPLWNSKTSSSASSASDSSPFGRFASSLEEVSAILIEELYAMKRDGSLNLVLKRS